MAKFSKIILLVVAVGLVVRVGLHLVTAGDFVAKLQHGQEYDHVLLWQKSSQCAAEHGVLLSICARKFGKIDGEIVFSPLETFNSNDDIGYALTLNLAAIVKGNALSFDEMAVFHMYVNLVSFLLLALLLWFVDLKVFSILVLAVLPSLGLPGEIPSADNITSYPGTVCLSLLPLVAIYRFWIETEVSNYCRLFLLVISFAGIAVAFSYRSSIGFSVLPIYLGIIFFISAKHLIRVFWGWRVTMISALLLSLLVPSALIGGRDMFLVHEDVDALHYHSFWHNAFVGLGWKDNPWGLAYSDKDGEEYVLSRHPKIKYLSEDYNKKTRELYLQAVWDHPITVFKIYVEKLKETLKLIDNWWKPLFSMLVFFALYLSSKLELKIFLVSVALFCSWLAQLAQGVLAFPYAHYVYQAEVPGQLLFLSSIYYGLIAFSVALCGWYMAERSEFEN